MNKRKRKFCSTVWLLLLVLGVISDGCGLEKRGKSLDRQRLPGPSIAVSVEDSLGERQTDYFDLADFPVSKRSKGGFISQHGVAINDETTLRLALFKNEEDSSIPGNRLITLEITYNDEILRIDDIPWNMRDELHVCGGACWRVFLTNYEERTNAND